ncbi:sodium-independent sulfate anion transporter isoform X2 [Cygnus olor]|uniref:sodium-independent sulfate anion transporter isoform X2 n=1 Tax=Cygnus olor TaxID=8869 RepID=UPI001ADE7228|nr:sodium-independent sulfate anion transporter isoform X2 [Cygnus olor]
MWARGPPEPRRRCWLRAVRRRLPILGWLPRYSPGWLQLDLIAGVTVGLTVVPQALAYAEVAGLPPQYGLYSSFVGCFVYCFLGTAKDVTLGPTAIMSLLVSSYAFHDPVYAVLLTFLAGCIQLAMGLLHLGFLLDFISCPVIKGFTSAASITISFNQVKNILGLHGIPRQFFLQVYETLRRIGETRPGDAILGLVCLAMLAGLRAMKSRLPPTAHMEPLATRASYLIVWTCATARNALVVLFAGLVAYCFQLRGSQPLTLTGSIPRGLPPCRLPPFSKAVPNGTVPFGTMVEDMGVGLAVVPLMGLVETVAIAKAFASQNDYRIDPNQELLAMGFANVLGSFFSSYPVTGSFGRTAVNAQTGVCTPAGGLVTGALVLLSLAYLTSLFYYIPKAALAAVIISAVVPMFDAGIFRTLWRVKSEGTSGAAVPRLSLRATALPGSMRAGPCPPLRDVPVLLLGGAVRHCGRGAGLRDPAALLHRQAPAEGVGAGHAAGAAGEQPALPSHRAPPGCHLQPRSVSTLTMLHHPGLPPHQQHRLHGGGGAGRAAAGAAQARHLAGLLQSAGPGSPSPAGCRPGRIPTFPQLGGGRAVQRSGAGRQRGSPLRQHQRQRELAAAHGAHPVRQRSRVGLSQDHISLPEQLFPMAPEAARPVQAGQCPAV